MEALVIDPVEAPRMPENQRLPKSGPDGKQLGLRVDKDMRRRLEDTANGLGLEVSSFLRMMVTENIGRYERRVAAIRRGEDPDQAPKEDGEVPS